jgi:putative methyltransferase (TIGR04325 family)
VLKALRRREEREPAEAPPPEPAVEPEPAEPPEWEYVPEGWARPAGGWDVEPIARAYRSKWPAFLAAVEGPGTLGVNHEAPEGEPVPRDDRTAEHTILAFGYVLALAARSRERVSVLDWGGGPGHYAVLAEALVEGIELDYHSCDVPPVAALGRELLPQHTFHDGDDWMAGRYDLVLASGSLQYGVDWRAALSALAAATGDYLYVTRLPIAHEAESFVVLQRAHRYGYETEYLGWVVNRAELLEHARATGLRLVREIMLPAWLSADGAPEAPVEHRGFLFRR